jgi:hypothetical protein
LNGTDELPAVAALRSLSVFTADQAGAYREHFGRLASALGDDIETRLFSFVKTWAASDDAGIIVLTGNAGTGKTAVAEIYCRVSGADLPHQEGLIRVSADSNHWVVKDLSGLPDRESRAAALKQALLFSDSKTLICANEGVLRDAIDDLADDDTRRVLDKALRRGAAQDDRITIVNVNRQRPTAQNLWDRLLDYVTREQLWTGCSDCPFDDGGCPMRSNAEQLRRPQVREQLRILVQLASGQAVPTLREVLAILSWAIVGNDSCTGVKRSFQDRGINAFTANSGYYGRLLGGGLGRAEDRSALLTAMRGSGLGQVSDLELDGWLRDCSGAPDRVREIAGDPTVTRSDLVGGDRFRGLAGTLSPLDRVRTSQGEMTFCALGEMVSTDEDPVRVEDGLFALVWGDAVFSAPIEELWRQRVYFEAPADLGGSTRAARRLLGYGHITDLVSLAAKAAAGEDTVIELNDLILGLNFLVTGFASPTEGLIVPDPACLFARDPGSFRPARPSLVHSQILVERLAIEVPDRGLVERVLDVDHIDVDLVVDGDPDLALRLTPRMYEAVREAAHYHGPVGQGVAEMNGLRSFYGRLAERSRPDSSLRVADPESNPPALVTVTLPHFVRDGSN